MTAKKVTEAPKKAAAAVKVSEPVQAETAGAAVKEAPVKKETEAAKAPAKKAAPRKAAAKTTSKTTKTAKTGKEAVSQNVYIQFAGKEILAKDIEEQVKKIWTEEGHRASSIKSLDIYVKPEDGAAYYVINGKSTGKIEL